MKHFLLIALLFAIYFLCAFSCNAQRQHHRWHQIHFADTLKVAQSYATVPSNVGSYTIVYSGTPIITATFTPIEKHEFWYTILSVWMPFVLIILIILYGIFKGRQDEKIAWPEDHNDSEDDSGYGGGNMAINPDDPLGVYPSIFNSLP